MQRRRICQSPSHKTELPDFGGTGENQPIDWSMYPVGARLQNTKINLPGSTLTTFSESLQNFFFCVMQTSFSQDISRFFFPLKISASGIFFLSFFESLRCLSLKDANLASGFYEPQKIREIFMVVASVKKIWRATYVQFQRISDT